MILAEVLHSPTNFQRLETFQHRGEAKLWIEQVMKTDPAIQSCRNHCFLRISDIPSRQVLVEALYGQWR